MTPAPEHARRRVCPFAGTRAIVATTFAALCLVLAAAPAAPAAVYVVGTPSDNGTLQTCSAVASVSCSLRGAITLANSTSGVLDTINFSPPLAIALGSPLPAVTDVLMVTSPAAASVVVYGDSGSGYDCSPTGAYATSYALDLTAAGATGSRISGLPINSVCGRAIRSSLAAPVLRLGPRRADNSVPVGGAASGDQVDVFHADTSGDGEADANGYVAGLPVVNGAFGAPVSPPVAPGEAYTATASDLSTTSNFSERAIAPSDLTSPDLTNAVAVSNARVRLDFNESLGGGSANPQAVALSMGGAGRAVSAASVSGNSLFLDSSQPWDTGAAGSLSITGNGRIADVTGNELLGQPSAFVFPGPGEVDAPVISSYRFSPDRLCQKVKSTCKRGSASLYFTLNKSARVIFKVSRGSVRFNDFVTFVHKAKAGRNKFKFDAVVSGRTLPATVLTVRAVAQDVARTNSAPVDARVRVVKNKRDL